LNNLHHVISLDFARDAYLNEDPELVIPPPAFVFSAVPITQEALESVDMRQRNRENMNKKAQKKRDAESRARVKAALSLETPAPMDLETPAPTNIETPVVPMRTGGSPPRKRIALSPAYMPVQ
jgi:hypothetical protein